MRSTSNPAFRNLPVSGGYAGFQQQAPGHPQEAPGYGGYQQPVSDDRPMTVDDVVTKTAMTLGAALVVGIITAIAVLSEAISPYPPMIIGLLGGLGLALVVIFKKTPNPGLVLAYSAFEGLFLGAITGVFEALMPGIALQAILGTSIVFGTMLVVYKTGAVKVTPRLTKWIIGAVAGAAGLMLVNLVLGLFGVDMGIRSNTATPLAIGISVLFIGIAAFSFLLDFDQADKMIRAGTPAKFAWYVAFGLMTTLVWLYLEVLRLLYMLQSGD
ncbi:Bax inhibitor-1/YccA family protein [Actinokineospora pegani]|uniref:Bax inhibitor-1/YccA family protein n=1 Tax=Actinokineospora pegani TaxID=2654637 RepID=UPI0012EACBA3|nr:Bax inhibitor-1/YccA family protein [Actinokineospora pegani]